MMAGLDHEIRAVETRIARERIVLAALINECEETARDTIAAPGNLLAVVALGFALGKALRPVPAAAPARKHGLKGLLAGAAFALVRARYGSPWGLARRLWTGASPRARGPWYPDQAPRLKGDDAPSG